MNRSLQEDKERLRRELLKKRRSLSAAEVASQSRQITGYFCCWPFYRGSKTVMFYLAMPDEPQTEFMIRDALRCGKRVCVPLLGEKYGEMSAALITSLDDLVTGKLGLKMPDPGKTEIISPDQIDLVVVPAVAFDRAGNRLGMGAGYYDRFLVRSPGCILLGVAWESLIMEQIPAEKHDIRMRCLLTEEGFWSCQQGEG